MSVGFGDLRDRRFSMQSLLASTSQRWAFIAADTFTWQHWDDQTVPAASAGPPLGPLTLGGHSGLPGPAHFSGPRTSRSLCPGPCTQSHKPLLQFQLVSHRGCLCPGPWPPLNRLKDKMEVKKTHNGRFKSFESLEENTIFQENQAHNGNTKGGGRTSAGTPHSHILGDKVGCRHQEK